MTLPSVDGTILVKVPLRCISSSLQRWLSVFPGSVRSTVPSLEVQRGSVRTSSGVTSVVDSRRTLSGFSLSVSIRWESRTRCLWHPIKNNKSQWLKPPLNKESSPIQVSRLGLQKCTSVSGQRRVGTECDGHHERNERANDDGKSGKCEKWGVVRRTVLGGTRRSNEVCGRKTMVQRVALGISVLTGTLWRRETGTGTPTAPGEMV